MNPEFFKELFLVYALLLGTVPGVVMILTPTQETAPEPKRKSA